jgi:hypothetical protein
VVSEQQQKVYAFSITTYAITVTNSEKPNAELAGKDLICRPSKTIFFAKLSLTQAFELLAAIKSREML